MDKEMKDMFNLMLEEMARMEGRINKCFDSRFTGLEARLDRMEQRMELMQHEINACLYSNFCCLLGFFCGSIVTRNHINFHTFIFR